MIYYNCEIDSWTMPQAWVVFATDDTCSLELLSSSSNRLGLDQTFFITSILFFIVGMGFGTSYSLVHVDCLDWVHTMLHLRLIRGFAGSALAFGIFTAFQQIPCNDNPTRFFFLYALPALSLSFFIFGVYPILCQKIGLVKTSGAPKVVDLSVTNSKKSKKSMIDSISERDSDDKTSSLIAP
jgi:hypothetical protein